MHVTQLGLNCRTASTQSGCWQFCFLQRNHRNLEAGDNRTSGADIREGGVLGVVTLQLLPPVAPRALRQSNVLVNTIHVWLRFRLGVDDEASVASCRVKRIVELWTFGYPVVGHTGCRGVLFSFDAANAVGTAHPLFVLRPEGIHLLLLRLGHTPRHVDDGVSTLDLDSANLILQRRDDLHVASSGELVRGKAVIAVVALQELRALGPELFHQIEVLFDAQWVRVGIRSRVQQVAGVSRLCSELFERSEFRSLRNVKLRESRYFDVVEEG